MTSTTDDITLLRKFGVSLPTDAASFSGSALSSTTQLQKPHFAKCLI